MSALWELLPGERVWEAATYYDDGDNPIAREGWSSYERSERAAEAFAARRAVRIAQRGIGRVLVRHDPPRPGGRPDRGRLPQDRSFDPDADWSRTLLVAE